MRFKFVFVTFILSLPWATKNASTGWNWTHKNLINLQAQIEAPSYYRQNFTLFLLHWISVRELQINTLIPMLMLSAFYYLCYTFTRIPFVKSSEVQLSSGRTTLSFTVLEWTICYWRHRQWMWSAGSLDRCSLSPTSFLRHEDYSFWNVNACSLVDGSVLEGCLHVQQKVCILKMAAPPSSKCWHLSVKHGITVKKIVAFVFTGSRSLSHAYVRQKNIKFVETEWFAFIRVSAICLPLSWYREFVLRTSSCRGMKLTTPI